jgi:hypothetical protein
MRIAVILVACWSGYGVLAAYFIHVLSGEISQAFLISPDYC